MNGKTIKRKTEVLSVSLDPSVAKLLNELATQKGQSKSSIISSMIKETSIKERWRKLRVYGRKKAKELGITSEEDVYKLMGDA